MSNFDTTNLMCIWFECIYMTYYLFNKIEMNGIHVEGNHIFTHFNHTGHVENKRDGHLLELVYRTTAPHNKARIVVYYCLPDLTTTSGYTCNILA